MRGPKQKREARGSGDDQEEKRRNDGGAEMGKWVSLRGWGCLEGVVVNDVCEKLAAGFEFIEESGLLRARKEGEAGEG